MYTQSIGVLQVYSIYENKLSLAKTLYSDLYLTKLYKNNLRSLCLLCVNKFDAYLEKARFVKHTFQKQNLPLPY